MAVVDRSLAEHDVWKDVCDDWHLPKHPRLSGIQENVPPACSEPAQHQSHAVQFFFVLRGTASMWRSWLFPAPPARGDSVDASADAPPCNLGTHRNADHPTR